MIQFIVQPHKKAKYVELFQIALKSGVFTNMKAAFAYSTLQGCNSLKSNFDSVNPDIWNLLNKKWLLGIDWCRSEPDALSFLENFKKSKVRIYSGRELVRRHGCTPKLPFHPKVAIFKGNNNFAIVSGSGNLSKNGMTQGHECGSVLYIENPKTQYEKSVWNNVLKIDKWFNSLWSTSSKISSVLRLYKKIYYSIQHFGNPTPTDDDATSSTIALIKSAKKNTIDALRLRQLRAANSLWIFSGNLHENRGKNRPGNQLMLSPMTRVFFGFPATDIPRDTFIGDVKIKYKTFTRNDCSLRYSNNSMDVLTLPVPVTEGPNRYDRKYLLFTKTKFGAFNLIIGTFQKKLWMKNSKQKNSFYLMTSHRKWGVF